MPQTSLTLKLPDSLAREFDRALDVYSRGGISFGGAAERAGVSRADLAGRAYSRGMEPSFSSETLAEELGYSLAEAGFAETLTP